MCLRGFQSVSAVISSGGAIVISIPSSLFVVVCFAVLGWVLVPVQNRLQPIIQRRMMSGRSIITIMRFRTFFSIVEELRVAGYSFCEFGICIVNEGLVWCGLGFCCLVFSYDGRCCECEC